MKAYLTRRKTPPCPIHGPLLRTLFCLSIAGTAAALHGQAVNEDEGETITLSPFVVETEHDIGYMASDTLAGSRFKTPLRDTPASISVFTAEFISDIGAFTIEEALEYAVNVEMDLDDSRTATTNNQIFESYQTYRTRGLDASSSRNFVGGERAPSEMALVDRLEDSRGPNAVLFGLGSPAGGVIGGSAGGVMNVSTKQALTGRDFQKFSFSVSSFDSYRATADINQSFMGDKLALRLNLVYNDSNTFRHWQGRTDQRGQLAVKYELTDRTRVRVEFERGQMVDNRAVTFNLLDQFSTWDAAGRPTFPTRVSNAALGIGITNNNVRVTYYSTNDTVFNMQRNNISSMQSEGTGLPVTDRSIVDFSVNHGGPGQNRYSRFGEFSTFVEHQLGPQTFFEIGYHHRAHSFDARDPRGARRQFFGDPNELNADGSPNPFAGQQYLEAQWFRITRWDRSDTGRAMLTHELDAGKWGHYRIGSATEYQKGFNLRRTFRELWQDAETGLPAFHPTPDNANNNVFRRSYPTIGDWKSYHVSGPVGSGGLLSNVFDPVTGRTLSSDWVLQAGPRENYTTMKSGMIVTQARYFNRRLVLAGGLRRDEYDERQIGQRRNPDTLIWEIARDPALAEVAPTENSAIGRTKTMGAVYHVIPWLSVFYNWSDNLSVPSRGQTMLHPSGDPELDPVPVPKPQGTGEDYGVAMSLFDGRIYMKGTVYRTQARDQSTTALGSVKNSNDRIMEALLAQGLISQAVHDRRTDVGGQGLFGHESKGHELQITGNPLRNWRFQVNYSESSPVEHYRFPEWLLWQDINRQFLSQFDQNIILGNGRTITQELEEISDTIANQQSAINIGKLGNRRHKWSMFTRYDIRSGWLKGAFIGGGYRQQSKMFVGTYSDTNQIRYGNSYWYADALAGYTVSGLPKGRKLNFQLNLYNIFNEREPLIIRYESDTDAVLREAIRPPLTWRFTTNFEF